MAKASSGWYGESLRHSKARKYARSQLKIGKQVEKEHSNTLKYLKKHPNTPLSKAEERIAKDHLREDPYYYTKLKKAKL